MKYIYIKKEKYKFTIIILSYYINEYIYIINNY